MIRIAIIGPESTGKSDLSQALAAHFSSPWEPEPARAYLENLASNYTFDDVVEIARRQIALEKQYETRTDSPFVFFDTELIITKVWFEHKYGVVPPLLTDYLAAGRFFHHYLLCKPDLPWVPDPLRENGHNREMLFQWYKKELETLGHPYTEIGGTGQMRLNNALNALHEAFPKIRNRSNDTPNLA